MTPEAKDRLIKPLIRLLNVKTIATTLFSAALLGIGTLMVTGFSEVKDKLKSDHNSVKQVVPIVSRLHKSDSTHSFQIISIHSNLELMKATQKVSDDNIEKDLEELKSLVYQILRQTK